MIAFSAAAVLAAAVSACGRTAPQEPPRAEQEEESPLFESTLLESPYQETDLTPTLCLEANRPEALVSHYDSVSVEIHYASDDTSERYYLAGDRAYLKTPFSETVMTPDDFCGFEEAPGEGSRYFFRAVNASDEPYRIFGEVHVMDTETAREGHFIEVKRDDTSFLITSEVSRERTKEVLEKENLLHLYEEGDVAVCHYVFGVQDLALSEVRMVLREEDGTERDIYDKRVFYNSAEPSAVEEILKRARKEGDQRTITLTLDAGTDRERTFEQSVGKGDHFMPLLPENYRLFLDPAGEHAYVNGTSDLNEDLKLYSREATLTEFREAGGLTLEEVVAANRTGTLLARYGSFLRVLKTLPEDQGYQTDLYLDASVYYASDSNGLKFVKNADTICMLSQDATGAERFVRNENTGGFHPSEEAYGLLLPVITEREHIIRVQKHERTEEEPYDHAILIVTAVSHEDSLAVAESNDLGAELLGKDGQFIEYYLVNPDTLALYQDRSLIGHPDPAGPDGYSLTEISLTRVTYQADPPGDMEILLKRTE